MGIDQQVILLHVRHKERVTRIKTVIYTHTVYHISGSRTRQTRYREVQTIRMPPLTDSRVLHDHMIIERLQIIDEVGSVIPLAEILRRYAITTVHRRVAHLRSPQRPWTKDNGQ